MQASLSVAFRRVANSQPVVVALVAGAALIAACSNSATGPAAVGTVPALLTATSGGGQTGAVGGTVAPLVVTVTDAKGLPVPGVLITFVGSAGVVVADTAVPTDSVGQATSTFTLGPLVGADTVTASLASAGLSTTFAATVTAGAPSAIILVSGSGQTALHGTQLTLPFVVTVTDQFGNLSDTATVNWLATAGTVSSPSSVSDITGRTSIQFTLPATAGTDTVFAALNDSNARVLFIVIGN